MSGVSAKSVLIRQPLWMGKKGSAALKQVRDIKEKYLVREKNPIQDSHYNTFL